MTSKIEFLKPVNVRSVWSKEDKDFTPWISRPEVTATLLSQCEIEYDGELMIKREVEVPGVKRKLDVLVESTTGDRIAIENQFNELDHDHMTRALAYAVGLEAKAVIIIAESHRPEFVAVAEYLNAAALAYKEKGIPVFLVAIQLFTSSSQETYFPQFEVVVRPDEWKAVVFQGTHGDAAESDRDIGIFNFHDQFLPDVRTATGMFKNVKSSANNWKAGSFGLGGVQVTYNVSKQSTFASIWIAAGSSSINSAGLEALRRHEQDIKSLLKGFDVSWRVQETSSLDISIEGVGWGGTDHSGARDRLLQGLTALATIARKYEPELRLAIDEARRKN